MTTLPITARGEGGADVVVQRHPHIPRAVEEGLPGVLHDGFGAQALVVYLPAQFPQQGRGVPKLLVAALQQSPGFLHCKGRLGLPAQAVCLCLFLQHKQGKVPVVKPQPEFLPVVNAFQFFPQGLVRQVVEVQAAHLVAAAQGVGVPLEHSPQPGPQRQQAGGVNAVFPFMAQGHGISSFLCVQPSIHSQTLAKA